MSTKYQKLLKVLNEFRDSSVLIGDDVAEELCQIAIALAEGKSEEEVSKLGYYIYDDET